VLEVRGVLFPPAVEVSGNTSFGLECFGGSQYVNDASDPSVFFNNNGGGVQVSCTPF
jgi:hypothetical protein